MRKKILGFVFAAALLMALALPLLGGVGTASALGCAQAADDALALGGLHLVPANSSAQSGLQTAQDSDPSDTIFATQNCT